MILTYQKDNHLYLAIQDFEDKIETVYTAIKTFPENTPKLIKKILDKNFFSDTLQRQRNYISNISTYINGIYENDKQQYFLHLYILPKDLDIHFSETDTDEEKIYKCEQLSIKLFRLYSQLDIGKRDVEIFNHYKGDSFLQLEAYFYIDKLDRLYSYLLNYKAHHTNKVICSDKMIGVEIDELNRMESNPLKNYQFIKVAYQKELIHFVYSIMSFLKKFRIKVFELTCNTEFRLLHKRINRINNMLLKISTHKDMIDEGIKKDKLAKYLQQNKNKKEIKENRKIFALIESIFYTQLSKDVQFFQSMNLPKIFEKIVEQKLINQIDNLFVGDEDKKEITYLLNGNKDEYLSSINFLLKENGRRKKSQYPDFLIRKNIDDTVVYHIIDAKYKIIEKVINEADIRQVLIYSILFNKEYSQTIENQKNIEKFIIYADRSKVHLDNIETLVLDTEPIDIFTIKPDILCDDNVLDSHIEYIGIKTLQNLKSARQSNSTLNLRTSMFSVAEEYELMVAEPEIVYGENQNK